MGELEDLYLREDDEAFLKAAHGDGHQAGGRDLTPVADLYEEVVERVLPKRCGARSPIWRA
ncbi:MAG: hypothetical protein V3T72_19740 [Thermoanaerobaculia bacterium]